VFVAVQHRSEAQRRPGVLTVCYQNAARNRVAVERHAGRPVQHIDRAGGDRICRAAVPALGSLLVDFGIAVGSMVSDSGSVGPAFVAIAT
jgi:hypothetical protein